MDDFLSILLVAVIYLFAAFSKAGKKKEKRSREKRGPMRARMRGEQRDGMAAARDRETQSGSDNAFETRQTAVQPPEHDCVDMRQMHLHEISQRQFEHAHEGDDPCHVGQSDLTADRESLDMQEMEKNGALAQDMLRGVIMSEVLMRPQDRAALRRGRR